MSDTWIDKIKHFYWQHWPYDWRPGQAWYRLECFLWHRYSTIRPRYLGHTWSDRCELMSHAMFEILSQFVEQECSPGHVEWYGEWGHKIGDKYVRDEMQELYDWWHTIRNKEMEEVNDMLWAEAHKHEPFAHFVPIGDGSLVEWKQQFYNDEDEAIYKCCLNACNKLERMMDAALQERLHRLVNIIPYLWT